jgi:hypothetical protein
VYGQFDSYERVEGQETGPRTPSDNRSGKDRRGNHNLHHNLSPDSRNSSNPEYEVPGVEGPGVRQERGKPTEVGKGRVHGSGSGNSSHPEYEVPGREGPGVRLRKGKPSEVRKGTGHGSGSGNSSHPEYEVLGGEGPVVRLEVGQPSKSDRSDPGNSSNTEV